MNPAGSVGRIEFSASESGTRIEKFAGRTGDHSLGRALGYFILRLSLGVDMVMHYVVRTWGNFQQGFRSRHGKNVREATSCRCRGCTFS